VVTGSFGTVPPPKPAFHWKLISLEAQLEILNDQWRGGIGNFLFRFPMQHQPWRKVGVLRLFSLFDDRT
jgi:hypothetical protein